MDEGRDGFVDHALGMAAHGADSRGQEFQLLIVGAHGVLRLHGFVFLPP